MKLCNTTGVFAPFHLPQLDRLKLLKSAGYCNIDVSFYREGEPDSVFMQDNWTECADAMKSYAEDHGLSFVQAHCPMGNPLAMDDKRELLITSTIRSLEVCGHLGIKNAVFHPGWEIGISREELIERNLEFLKELIPTLEATGVTLCYENLIRRANVDRKMFYTGDEFLEYLHCADNHPLVQVCWDTGHANVSLVSQYDEIVKLGNHLRALHIQDNRGQVDEHLLPYMGTTNWDEIMNALLDINYPGYFTLEAGGTVRFDNNDFFPRNKYEKDTRALNPSVDVQVAMLRFGHEIGKNILSAYDCYEEP